MEVRSGELISVNELSLAATPDGWQARNELPAFLEFPAERPSASLSQGVVVVFRAADRYHVWAVLH